MDVIVLIYGGRECGETDYDKAKKLKTIRRPYTDSLVRRSDNIAYECET